MKKLNVGVIGYGWVASAHIPAINQSEHAHVTAVCSSRPLDASALRAEHKSECDIQCYRDWKELVADPSIDAVSICSYPDQHVEQAVAAARAGKHLIIEKPLALSLDGMRQVEEAVRDGGVRTCVCFECRYSSQFLTTKAVIDQGLLGRIHYGEIDYYHGIGPWYGQFRWNITRKAGGSSLLSAGCHALDALLLCMGNEVETVTSMASSSAHESFKKYEYPTTSVTLLQFKDGRIGKVASVIDCLQPYYFHTHLVGSEGSLLDNKMHSTKLGGLDKSRWSELSMKLLDSGDVSDHPYEAQFDAFFQAIRNDSEMPLTGLRDAAASFKVIFAADRSAAERRPVNMNEMEAE